MIRIWVILPPEIIQKENDHKRRCYSELKLGFAEGFGFFLENVKCLKCIFLIVTPHSVFFWYDFYSKIRQI